MKFVRRKIAWKSQSVDEYGGDGEYAGSFTDPDFVEIQRAEPGGCIVARHHKSGHWFWFWEDDTLLPWTQLGDLRGACECHDGKRRSFMPARMLGPFATEAGAKVFGESFAREKVYRAAERRQTDARAEKARQAITDLLLRVED